MKMLFVTRCRVEGTPIRKYLSKLYVHFIVTAKLTGWR
jgi:hypothetical protein